MSNNNPQTKTNLYSQQAKTPKNKQSLTNVRQDNARFSTARSASRQPAPDTKCDRAVSLDNAIVCSHYPNSHQNRTEKLTLWVKPIVKDELERQAKREALSLSAVGAASLECYLQISTDLQYTALLEPIIKKCIDKHMNQYQKATNHLLIRLAYNIGQVRLIATNILNNLPGMTQSIFRGIIANCEKSAKANIARLTPQLAELIARFEKWFQAGEGEEKPHR